MQFIKTLFKRFNFYVIDLNFDFLSKINCFRFLIVLYKVYAPDRNAFINKRRLIRWTSESLEELTYKRAMRTVLGTNGDFYFRGAVRRFKISHKFKYLYSLISLNQDLVTKGRAKYKMPPFWHYSLGRKRLDSEIFFEEQDLIQNYSPEFLHSITFRKFIVDQLRFFRGTRLTLKQKKINFYLQRAAAAWLLFFDKKGKRCVAIKKLFTKIFLLKKKKLKFLTGSLRSGFNKTCISEKRILNLFLERSYRFIKLFYKTFIFQFFKKKNLFFKLINSFGLVQCSSFFFSVRQNIKEKNSYTFNIFFPVLENLRKKLIVNSLVKDSNTNFLFLTNKLNKMFFEQFFKKLLPNNSRCQLSTVLIDSLVSTTFEKYRARLIDYVFKRVNVPTSSLFFLHNFINLLVYSLKMYSVSTFTEFLSHIYFYRKTQRRAISLTKRILACAKLTYFEFLGLTILISGKLGRRPRAKATRIVKRSLPKFSTLNIKVQYAYRQSLSNFGVYGVKCWLYYF